MQRITVWVPKTITKMHVVMGYLPEELSHCRSFYFITSIPGKLEFEQLDEVLECGVLSEGPSLRILEQVGGDGDGMLLASSLQ